MASNITLSYFGPPEQKHVIKVPPMQTLSQTLQAAASKFKPALVPDHCSLQYNKKPVDLNTPFRLLNVPAGSKLEVIINKPQQAPSPPGTSTAQQATAAPTAPPPPGASAGPAPAAANTQPLPAHAQQQQQAQPAGPQAPAAATPAAVSAPADAAAAAAAAAAAVPSGSDAGAGPSSTAAAAADSSGPSAGSQASPLASLGVQGRVYVFHQRTLEAAAAQGPRPMELDPPDDFFELTPDDLVRLQQQANAKKRQETLFKPRAMREAEAAARAATLGPVRVRLHFPDATIVQASFNASQPLSAVQQLVTQLALEPVSPALYLYTTPPKTILKDPTATLYQLKLVPAAHVYVGCEAKRLKPSAQAAVAAGSYLGPFLKPEVLKLMQDTLPQLEGQEQEAGQHGAAAGQQGGSSSGAEASAADAQRVLAAAAAASRAEGGGGRGPAGGAAGAKVPKWLKMGK